MIGSPRARRTATLLVCYGIVGAFMVFFLFPPYWMALTSLKTNQEIESLEGIPLIIQQGATLKHYRDLFTKTDFLVYLKNSVLVTVPTVLVSMVISVMAAYALSRLGFLGAGVIGTGVFLVYLVPDSLLFIPLFKVIGGLGLSGSLAMSSAMTADIFGRFSVGSIFGWIFLSHQVGAALGSWLGGFLFDLTGGYGMAFGSACALLLVAAGLAATIQESRRPVATLQAQLVAGGQ